MNQNYKTDCTPANESNAPCVLCGTPARLRGTDEELYCPTCYRARPPALVADASLIKRAMNADKPDDRLTAHEAYALRMRARLAQERGEMMIDQNEPLEIRLARARLQWHQDRRAAAVKWQAVEGQSIRDRHMADSTVTDCDRQIARIVAWLEAQGQREPPALPGGAPVGQEPGLDATEV